LNSDVYADDVFVTSDNRILVSGASDDSNPRPFVMRLNHNGTPDSSFATSGMWRGTSLIGRMYSVTIQIDGRILAAGGLDNQGTMSVGVVRLANTVDVTTTTTTVAPLVTTSTTVPPSTIAPEQLPATGSQFDSLTAALLLTALGSIVVAARRRSSH
jgi:LPXTG-motif cell wall-anchored protein